MCGGLGCSFTDRICLCIVRTWTGVWMVNSTLLYVDQLSRWILSDQFIGSSFQSQSFIYLYTGSSEQKYFSPQSITQWP